MKILKVVAAIIFIVAGVGTGICAVFGTRYASVQRGDAE